MRDRQPLRARQLAEYPLGVRTALCWHAMPSGSARDRRRLHSDRRGILRARSAVGCCPQLAVARRLSKLWCGGAAAPLSARYRPPRRAQLGSRANGLELPIGLAKTRQDSPRLDGNPDIRTCSNSSHIGSLRRRAKTRQDSRKAAPSGSRRATAAEVICVDQNRNQRC